MNYLRSLYKYIIVSATYGHSEIDMSYRRAITMLITSLVFLIFGGSVSAQELLPVPPSGNTVMAETAVTSVAIPSTRNTRADSTFVVSYYWYANNPNLPWNGNGITYSFANFGPADLGIAYIDYNASRGSCTIQNAGQDVVCNFGSSIPGTVIVYISLVVQFADTIDWFVVEGSVSGNFWYYNYVTNPFAYSTNIVPDPSFEVKGLPSWNLVPGAKRACNTALVIVSYDANCALQLRTGGRAALGLTLPETYNNGDVIWIGWLGASKNVQNFTKLVVISKSLSGQKAKSIWRVAEGTSDYVLKYINHHIPATSNKVTLKIVGAASGKAWFDLLNLLPVNFEEDVR
jgi:hypothetical protein